MTDIEHKIMATVLEVKWQSTNKNRIACTNLPIYPWDDLPDMKRQVKQSVPKHIKVLSMRKCKKLVLNPLIV